MHPTFDTALYKILNATGEICERTCCDKVLFYVANKFLYVIEDSVCVVDTMIFK